MSDIDIERLMDFIPFDTMPAGLLKDLTGCFTVHELAKGKVVYKRDQPLSDVYFLFDGALDLADAQFNITKLASDDVENYLAFETSPVAKVSAITTSDSLIVSIERNKLDVISRLQEAVDVMQDDKQAEDLDWMEALLSSELFLLVPPSNIQNLFARFEEVDAEMGEAVIRQGEEGDHFFVIKSGRALVSRKQGGVEETIAALRPGNYFGQDALIEKTVRNATITMATPGTLMRLNRDDFAELLLKATQRKISREELEKMMDESDTGTVLVDVRSAQEYKLDRFPGSINIPVLELRDRIRELESNFTYVVVCDGGKRAELGAHLLAEAGFTALLLDIPGNDAKPGKGSDDANAEAESS